MHRWRSGRLGGPPSGTNAPIVVPEIAPSQVQQMGIGESPALVRLQPLGPLDQQLNVPCDRGYNTSHGNKGLRGAFIVGHIKNRAQLLWFDVLSPWSIHKKCIREKNRNHVVLCRGYTLDFYDLSKRLKGIRPHQVSVASSTSLTTRSARSPTSEFLSASVGALGKWMQCLILRGVMGSCFQFRGMNLYHKEERWVESLKNGLRAKPPFQLCKGGLCSQTPLELQGSF